MIDSASPSTVSVILATRSPTHYLDEALGSISRQSHLPHQVILVNDGYPDRAAFDQLRFRSSVTHLVHQSWAGVSVAWNRALDVATGDLLAFIGDDDLWPPERLAEHVLAFSRSHAIVLTVDDIVMIDEHGRELFRERFPDRISREEVLSRKVGVLLGNSVVKRSAATLAGGFHPALLRVQDFDFVLNVMNFGDIGRAYTHLEYRQHANNATKNHRQVAEFQRVVAEAHRLGAAARMDQAGETALREFAERSQRYAAWSAARSVQENLRRGRPLAAADEARWALKTAPMAPLLWVKKRLSR